MQRMASDQAEYKSESRTCAATGSAFADTGAGEEARHQKAVGEEMVRRVCAGAAIFLLTLYCFFLYDDEIVAGLLVIEAIYILAAIVTLWILRRKLQVSMEPMIPIAKKNQEIAVRVIVKNTSRLPGVHVRVRLWMENSFTGEKSVCQLEGKAERKGQETLTMLFRVCDCGNIQITLDRCWIYDYLFLFRSALKLKETQRVGVLPECRLLMVEVSRRTREFLADAEEYSDQESGDDPSEIYQIREYREKDPIHDIHWKLSAKADELLVKERGKPLGCVVLIWLNLKESGEQIFNKKKGKKKLAKNEMFMNLLETASSLSLSLLEEKCVHMVAWYEPANQRVKKKKVSKEEHIYELLNRMLFVEPYQNDESARNQYEETFRGVEFSTVVEFRLDGSIWINGEERMKIPKQSQQMKWEELYFVL